VIADIQANIANPGDPILGQASGQTFTLTTGRDVAAANVFNSNNVLVDGSGFINTLNDNDVLTGTGANPTLNVELGASNDITDNPIVQPILNGIETVNVEWISNDQSELNFADATGLQTLNVTRVTANNPSIAHTDLDSTVTEIGLSNSTRGGTIGFQYREEVLTGTDETLDTSITNVRVSDLSYVEGGDGGADQGHFFETINLAANGANDIDNLTIQANGREDLLLDQDADTTKQDLNITAGAAAGATGSLEINTLNITGVDNMTIVANHRVDIALDKVAPLAPTDGMNSADLETLTITGAANVRIDGLNGQVEDFQDGNGLTVDGSAMTGNLRVGVEGGTAGDDLFVLTSGSGNDEIRTFGALGGDVTTGLGNDRVTVSDGEAIAAAQSALTAAISGGDPTAIASARAALATAIAAAPVGAAMLGTASINTGEGTDTVLAGDMGAIADEEENGNQGFGEALAASIVTGEGDDTVNVGSLQSAQDWNNGPSLLNQADDTYYLKGATIDTGAGNDDVSFLSVAEGASVNTGEGDDEVSVTLDKIATILAADSTAAAERDLNNETDLLGAVVDLGAGDDVISFEEVDTPPPGIVLSFTLVGNDAELIGGDGDDVLNVRALDQVTVVAAPTGTTTDTNFTVKGIETANLTVVNQIDQTSADATGQARNEYGSETDGRININVARFDGDLATINLTSEEAALTTAVNTEVWEPGTATTFTVQNLRSGIDMSLSANEATGVTSGALADDSDPDVFLSVDMADATGANDSFTLEVNAPNVTYTNANDVDLSLTFGATTTNPVTGNDNRIENVTINLNAGGSHYINVNGFGDSQFENSAINTASFMQWRNEDPEDNRLLSVYDDLTTDELQAIGQGYAVETSFTITGAEAGEDITIDNVTADVITVEGDSNVTVIVGQFTAEGLDSEDDPLTANRGNNYTITTGGGNDRFDMLEDLVDDEDAIDGGAGDNTLVIQGSNSMGFDDKVQTENDEVWANKSNIQTLEMWTGYDDDDEADDATVVLDEEAFDTGIKTIKLVDAGNDEDQNLTVILGEDFLREDFTIDANDVNLDLVTINYTNNQNDVDSTLTVELKADGGASFTLDDEFDRVTADLIIDINDDEGETQISSAEDSEDGEVDINVVSGAINSITLIDSDDEDNGDITITIDDSWSDSTLTVDASKIANDDFVDADDTNSDTGGMTFDGSAETDAVLVVTGTANDDEITGGAMGDTLNGGDGDDKITGDGDAQLNQQVTTITFDEGAGGYDTGDTIVVTITAGESYELTITMADDDNTAEDVVAAILAAVAAEGNTVTNGVDVALTGGTGTWADLNAETDVIVEGAAGTLTITGAVAGAEFTVNTVTTDADQDAQVQTVEFTDGGGDPGYIAFVTWNGTTYAFDQGGADVAPYDGLAEFEAAVEEAGGTLNFGLDELTITGPANGSAIALIGGVTVADSGDDSFVIATTAGVESALSEAAVATVTEAVVEVGGDDTIDGGAGDDEIVGGIGDDEITGGAGDDVITGGAGSDTLEGGAGADIFVYDDVSESSGNNVDTITDLTGVTVHDQDDADPFKDTTTGDVIDLTAIAGALGFDEVEFLGTFADDTVADTFLQTDSANLQVVYVTGDNALYVDVDASGDINDGDMVIELTGVVGTLTQANFNTAGPI